MSEWLIDADGEFLSLHGGADAHYVAKVGSSHVANNVAAVFSGGNTSALLPESHEVMDELAKMGIGTSRPTNAMRVLRIAVANTNALGAEIGELIVQRSSRADINVELVTRASDADLTLIVRTSEPLIGLYEATAGAIPATPHLLVDIAYHHTVSIGPIVMPGDTACLACLGGRVASLWGDAPVPPTPHAVTTYRDVAIELAALEIQRFAQGDRSLVAHTWTWNLEARSSSHEFVARLPWCPVCAPIAGAPESLSALEWVGKS